ncbi:hypothetical protein EMIT07CA2_20626 [Brevibacillus sp. IT-7CA2]
MFLTHALYYNQIKIANNHQLKSPGKHTLMMMGRMGKIFRGSKIEMTDSCHKEMPNESSKSCSFQ